MKLNYRAFNDNSSTTQTTPVLLLHGLLGSNDNLAGLGRVLAEHHPVYSLDLRNHGKSPHGDLMDYPTMAEDVEDFMDHHGIDHAHIIGHSMGGKVAMQIALQHPAKVDKLVVADIAPVTYAPSHDDTIDGMQLLADQPVSSRKEADSILSEYVPESPVRAYLLKNLIRNEQGQFQLRVNLASIKQHYAELRAAPEGMPFHGPTLFLKGSESAYIQSKHQDDMDALFPNSELTLIEGAGHWLHADHPEQFNQLVCEFLES